MKTDRSLPPGLRAALSFAGALAGLSALFISTMYRQFGSINWHYFWFGFWRITVIALGVGAIMYFARLPGRGFAAIFACILGFATVLFYYFAVVAGT